MFEYSTWLYLFVVLGIPAFFLFRSTLRSNKPPTRITLISNYFLLFTVAYQIYFAVFSPPSNLFLFLGIIEDAPLYKIRDSLQAYIDTHSLPEQTIEMWWYLYEKFKSDVNRHVYCFFGEHALLNCSWCREDFDYKMFILPSLAASYLFMLFLVWFVSSSSQRAYVRYYSIILLMIFSFVDIFAFAHGFKTFGFAVSFIYSTMDYYRRIAFAITALGLWCAGYARDAPELELLQQLVDLTEKTIGQLQSMKLFRSVCLCDPVLKPKFLRQAKQQEDECRRMHADLEYKRMWARVTRSEQMAELLKNAQIDADHVLQNLIPM